MILSPVMAQDPATAEPTAELTVTPGPPDVSPIEDPNVVGGLSSTVVFAIFASLFVIVQGVIQFLHTRNYAELLKGYKSALERKDVRDEVEQRYMQSSASIQDLVTLLHAAVNAAKNMNIPVLDDFLEEGGEFLDDVTDGRPNDA